MGVKKNISERFRERFRERFDDLDSGTRQAYILRLIRERGFMETVFNTLDEGIMVIDRQLKLRYFNRPAKELLALPDDTSELRVSQLLPDLDWRMILLSENGSWSRVVRQELEIFYPESRFVQLYLVPLPEEPELAVVILRDISESRLRTKSQLEQETVRAVSLLGAGVAHEIGNPLNSLYLNLQLLESSENNTEENKELIGICKKEVERLDSIIHRFLNAIRPGNGEFVMLDISQLVFEVLNFMRPEIEARKIEVGCNFKSPLPQISGNAEQLKQAFYNVIRNAVQAMTNGGKLDICGYPDGDSLIIEFADSGSGVTPENLSSIFQAFKTTKSGGNGIGTMIIERVCREHGADFGLVSEPGKGTIFRISFPLGGRRMRLLGNSQ